MGREALNTTAECTYSVTVGEAAKWTVEETDERGLQRRPYRTPEEKGLKSPPRRGP